MELNLEQVRQFLESQEETNEEVKTYLQGFKQFSVDEVSKFVNENQDAKKWFDSERDKHFSKGLDTWKTNNLEKLITDEIKKRNPDKTPEQIELEKLRADFEAAQRQLTLKGVKEKATTLATEKKIPLELLDFFVTDDEEKTNTNLSTFESVMEKYIKSQVEERLKGSYQPPAGGGGTGTQGITREKFQTMSYTERAKLKLDNPEVYEKLLKN
jgi:hypothetical protein